MAEAKGSSSSSSGGGGGVGHGDFVVGGPRGFQALLASVHAPAPGAADVHQYPAGLIHPAATMPARVPPPYAPQLTMMPPRLVAPPPQQQHCAQSHLPPGSYQGWPASNNFAAQQAPRGFVDWTMYNSAFMSLAHAAAYSNDGYHQNLRPCSTTAWPNSMLRNPCYSTYPPAIEDHQAPCYHSNNHEKDSGFAASFRVDPSLVPASTFPPMSPASNHRSSAQIFNEATYIQNVKNSEDQPGAFGSTDMESENSDEQDHSMDGELPSLNQSNESWTARFSCREYRVIVRKDLTNSDVGNIGRIVLPKRDAEANLPALLERDGVILKMDDFKIPATWNFKYRFWPNNKSRMYILESTGEFAKSHGLQAGDILIIYKNPESGKLLVRGEKAIQQNAPIVTCLECSCKKEDGNNSEECGFAMNFHTKRT